MEPINYDSGYSLYVGIPFCPTTCLYCSFTSYPISKWKGRTGLYLEALFKELEYTAEKMCIRDRYGWGINEVLQLQKNAVAAAFCTQEEKEKLYAYIDVFQKKLSAF